MVMMFLVRRGKQHGYFHPCPTPTTLLQSAASAFAE